MASLRVGAGSDARVCCKPIEPRAPGVPGAREGETRNDNAAGKRSLLVVDPDRDFAGRLASYFVERGWRVERRDPEVAPLSAVDAFAYVAIDVCPAGRPRFDLLVALSQSAPRVPVVALATFPSVKTAVKALRMGATDFIGKPLSPEQLEAVLRGGEDGGADADEGGPPSLGRVESDYIAAILAYTDHNISLSARILGIQRRTLQRKLKKYPPRR